MSDVMFEEFLIQVPKSEEYWIEFNVYRVFGMAEGKYPVYQDVDGQTVFDLDSAARYLTGSIKWDGCSNWKFEPDDEHPAMLHFCGCDDAQAPGRLFRKLYDLAAERMLRFDRSIADYPEPARPASPWQPIATAQRCDSFTEQASMPTILLHHPEYARPVVGMYSAWNGCWTDGRIDHAGDHIALDPTPTHWMPVEPLPAAAV